MSNFNLILKGHNGHLSYRSNGHNYFARVRISEAGYTYGVVSTESHSRQLRAFYPHRRALGTFQITVDLIHYQEFKRFIRWLNNYSDALFRGQMGNQRGATLMEVVIPHRNFYKYGILTSGIDDHDQVGSMTFSQELVFATVYDYNDPGTALTSTNDISEFKPPKVDPQSTLAFYPETVSSYKDTEHHLYDAPGPQFPYQHPPGGGTIIP